MTPDIKDVLTQHLDELLQFVTTQAQDAGSFVKEQAPLVIQEWLYWEYFSSVLYAISYALLSLLALFAILIYWLTIKRKWGTLGKTDLREGLVIGGTVVTGILLFVVVSLGSVSFQYALDAEKVKLAPRVVVLEKARGLLK